LRPLEEGGGLGERMLYLVGGDFVVEEVEETRGLESVRDLVGRL